MKNAIAIIGVSFELPNIKNWEDLKLALASKESFVGEIPEKRMHEIREAFGEIEMARVGYLDAIDQFDNEYFGFTERESLRTFPEHRLFLTNAMKAFYHAGYNETSLKSSRTGIFYTATKSAYHNYESVADISFSDFDFVNGIEATKLAKFLDLRGPVLSINASCSSSLVAINAAKHSLNAHECDLAIVGGVKTSALTKDATISNVVHSKTGHCRPFDQHADGMINGEGAVFFVLKRYEQALEDGDAILAEIRGVGINHGGSQISSLTAPSSNSQKEVILQAWKNAKVTPDQIRFIEAHGTGTILGDPIEIEGIKQALNEADPTPRATPFAISSFKGQIGHLDYLSGLAGLLRLVAALTYEIIPVQANFNQLNEHFDLKNTGLYVPTTLEKWTCDTNERVGGLSSFGMTGTNVHLVVAKKSTPSPQVVEKQTVRYLQLSHKNSQRLKSYKNYLIDEIQKLDDLATIDKLCSKLNKVFQINQENQSIVYTSKDSLISALQTTKPAKTKEPVVLLLDLEVCNYSKEYIRSVLLENVLIQKQWEKEIKIDLETIASPKALNVLFQFSLYKYLFDRLGNKLKLITPKENTIINKLIKSEITIQEAIDTAEQETSSKAFNEVAFKKYLKDNLQNQEVLLIDFSNKSKRRFDDLALNLKRISGMTDAVDRFALYATILAFGKKPLEVKQNPLYNDIVLPHLYPKRFWPTVKVKQLIPNTKNEILGLQAIKEMVCTAWTVTLELEDFGEEDSFFELGGSSLTALDMVEEIEKNIEGVKIPYEDIYTFETVSKLTKFISKQLNRNIDYSSPSTSIKRLERTEIEETIRALWSDILEIDNFENQDDFFELGGTSLAALDVIDELEKSIKDVKISYEDIYAYTTIEELSKLIFEQLKAQETPPVTEETIVISKEKPIKIDAKVRASAYEKVIHQLQTESLTKSIPKNILITGATGLLGTALIDYLLDHTEATLYCLVRKTNDKSSEKRFWLTYEKYYKVSARKRIRIVEGDLYKENLGLRTDLLSTNKIEMIFHVAGSPQFVSGKSIEEHINFIGTKHVVDWANKNEISKLNVVSTVGVVGKVMPPQVENFYETDLDLGQQSGALIHGASKRKAEAYLQEAYKYQAKVFRISNIGGRYRDGAFPTDLNKNLMWLRLKSLSQLPFYCNEVLDQSSGIALIPVDVIAATIAEIAFTKIDTLSTYHLQHRLAFSNGEVLTALKNAGLGLEQVPYDSFISYLNKNNVKTNFHQVAVKENNFLLRGEATDVLIERLNLTAIGSLDKQAYLERLINNNLKINNIKIAL